MLTSVPPPQPDPPSRWPGGAERDGHYRLSAQRKSLERLVDCALNQSRSFKGEDLLLLPTLLGSLNGTQSGSFVELGAYDGVTHSNSYMLERCFGWRGVLIEASPSNFQRLLKAGRTKSKLVHSAVCKEESIDGLEFADAGRSNSDAVAQTSGSLQTISRAKRAIARELNRTVRVPCKPLKAILAEHGLTKVDFLSLDVSTWRLEPSTSRLVRQSCVHAPPIVWTGRGSGGHGAVDDQPD